MGSRGATVQIYKLYRVYSIYNSSFLILNVAAHRVSIRPQLSWLGTGKPPNHISP